MRTLCSVLLTGLLAAVAFAAPEVRSVSPNKGIPSGGTLVTIHGSDLVPSTLNCGCTVSGTCAGLRVWFGGLTAAIRSASPEYILVHAPGGTGTSDIRIDVDGRPELTVSSAFTYDPFAAPTFGDSARYLVPITAFEVAGANGSLWTSELTVYNPWASTVTLRGRFCHEAALALCLPGVNVERDVMKNIRLFPRIGTEGAFLYVPKGESLELAKQLRVRDISRDEDNFGSEVPVVSVENDFSYTQRLLNVPTDPRYRTLLRIYAQDDRSDRVIVKVFADTGGPAIEQREVVLDGAPHASEFALNPAYAAIDPISELIRASGHQHVRIEVAAVSFPDPPPSTSIWAFVSLTNNETQQFTVITPQK